MHLDMSVSFPRPKFLKNLRASGNDEPQMHVDIPSHLVTHSFMEKTQTGNISHLRQQLSMKLFQEKCTACNAIKIQALTITDKMHLTNNKKEIFNY